MKAFSLFILLFFMSCASDRPLKKVDKVDTQRFMGKWYVIASMPTFIEKGAHNAVETYTWDQKNQRIDVHFSFRKDSFTGEEKVYPQKAWVHDSSGNEWRIQFLWPFKFPYLILELDEAYSYTVIGVPNRKYVWIMARAPIMSDETYSMLMKRIKDQGYDTRGIQKVPQKW